MPMRPMRAPRASALVLVLWPLLLLAAGCGDDDDTSTDTGSGTTMEMPDDGEEHTAFDFGEPADPDDATQTIQVSMLDSLAYEPPSITVPVGETVLFEVTNDGEIVHEFVLGDHELQLEHEEEMAEMSGVEMHDEPNAVTVEPGDTKQLAFTFTEAGSLEYACHEPAHYGGGMVGQLVVEES